MANTRMDAANSRRGADAGWPVADHRVGGTYCRVYRDIMDVDPDRAGCTRKSFDADRSLRRLGEGSLLDRMRDHGVVTRATPVSIRVAHVSRVSGFSRLRRKNLFSRLNLQKFISQRKVRARGTRSPDTRDACATLRPSHICTTNSRINQNPRSCANRVEY